MIDYAICRLSDDSGVSAYPNEPCGTGIMIHSSASNIDGNSVNAIKVRKSGRTTFVTEGFMIDKWEAVNTFAFNPPAIAYAMRIIPRQVGSLSLFSKLIIVIQILVVSYDFIY